MFAGGKVITIKSKEEWDSIHSSNSGKAVRDKIS